MVNQYNPYQIEPTFAYVNGVDGARNYPLPFGRSAVLMDTQSPMFYFKESSAMGQATIKAYKFEEVKVSEPQTAQYATKEEIDALSKKLDALLGKEDAK